MKQLSMYDDALLEHGLNEVQTTCQLTALPAPDAERDDNHKADKALANVTEIILAKEYANNIQMLLPMLTHLNQDRRWLAWIDPPIEVLKQWKATVAGKHAEDLLILRSSKNTEAAELMRRALAAGTCHAVITWTEHLSANEFNALEQASSEGNSHGIVLRYR
ncbi:MAG: SulA-like leucine-rich domain-containing protein [Oleiphilaceae bacterium]|nr:SulA-like leucine-rich domain-containing protein [Oleiphilaceae bacterium]